MKVILLENLIKIGAIGDIIEVKRGFARNYLIANKKALYASKENIKEVEKIKSDLGKKDLEKKKVAKARAMREAKVYEDLMNNLKKTEITIEVEVGGEDRLFGSVTSQNIHEALIEKGIEVDRHAILLEEPIKALGIYDIPVKITKGLNQEVKVYVIQA